MFQKEKTFFCKLYVIRSPQSVRPHSFFSPHCTVRNIKPPGKKKNLVHISFFWQQRFCSACPLWSVCVLRVWCGDVNIFRRRKQQKSCSTNHKNLDSKCVQIKCTHAKSRVEKRGNFSNLANKIRKKKKINLQPLFPLSVDWGHSGRETFKSDNGLFRCSYIGDA